MESGTLAAQGYRLRVPYGTLLCVSDKPLHGEIKLPGSASAFYQRAVGEHLRIGLAALDLLRGQTRRAAFAQAAQFRRTAVPVRDRAGRSSATQQTFAPLTAARSGPAC